ncbi:MAG: maltose alpha-D-glucosyltransferase [candidate division KSB1 bacterium]|nr:maltose alpha-D-glucosyltransferase [candidate division KSB1 bacterium]
MTEKGYHDSDPLWYKDAIIYQLHIKSFYDSNDDGIGDFQGLVQKLDYLERLGATAIWLLPFYPSPLRDDGYDISDYYNINPDYGSLRDFRKLLREAHKRNLRVITELVINHTSDQHPWFQRARRSRPGTVWRDFYVWSDTPHMYEETRIIFQDFEASNWTWDPVANAYFWHRFYSHQPDLNFDNPRVQTELVKALDFWLDMGVDGLRLDAVPYLYERQGTNCENLPETHDFLKMLRAHVDEKYENRMLLAEANQWPEDAAAYFGDGDECHTAFHFPVMPRLFMGLQMEDRFPIMDILEQTPDIPDTCQWFMFLRNHDELTLEMVTDEERDFMYRVFVQDPRARINLGIRRRLAPLLDNDRRKIELMNILLFSLTGTPVIYYGDEIGMGDNYYLGDRDGVRTPMQWSPDRNAGFSKTNPQKLYLPVIIDPEYHYEALNVENYEKSMSSLLWWMCHIIDMRKQYKAFGRGSLKFLYSDNPKVLVFLREYEHEKMLIVANLSKHAQVAELYIDHSDFRPVEVFSRNQFPDIHGDTPYTLTLSPYGYYWLHLEPIETDTAAGHEGELEELSIRKSWTSVFDNTHEFVKDVLPVYLKTCRWFGSKARKIKRVRD